MIRPLLIILMMMPALFGVKAAQGDTLCVRPVTSSYMAYIGRGKTTQQYLSSLTASGLGFGLGYERWQAMRGAPHSWSMRLAFDIEALHATPLHRPWGAAMWDLQIDAAWSASRRFYAGPFTIGAGPEAMLSAGCAYMQRNFNNPAAARLAVTAGVSAFAVYPVRIAGKNITLGLRESLPVTGIMFSPQYGESYYEIYLGNHKGLVHMVWPGNRLALKSLLWADLHLGNTTLRLGYQLDGLSTKVCNLITNRLTHMFVIGITSEGLSLDPSKSQIQAMKMIKAY